jgi:PDZ domain-containing protein
LLAGPALALAVAVIYRPPYLLVTPGSAIDLTEDVTIEGVPVTKPSGRYLLVTVHLKKPSALRAAFARFNPDVALVPEWRVLPPGVSAEEYLRSQKAIFKESQMAAAAAAAEATGSQVKREGEGARITDIVEGSPAAKDLKVGDVITRIDSTDIRLVSDMTSITTTQPPGTTFDVTVNRRGRNVTAKVNSARIPGFNAAGIGMGVLTTTEDLKVDLPFEVRFKKRSLGGPSAGLAYALAMTDMLDATDLARDRVIAATGAIYLNGNVGPVGGIVQKAIVAESAGAEVFLVPESELGKSSKGGKVRGVGTLGDALSALDS